MSFFKKKTKITVTPKDPVFYVRYVGSVETFKAAGRGCARLPVQKLWDGSDEEQNMRRVSVTISTTGLSLKNLESKKAKEQMFNIRNISYCNADSVLSRIFTWIYRHPDGQKVECYAVVCNSPEKAQAMALVLSRAFQIAYSDFKREQARTKRHGSKQDRTLSRSSGENGDTNGAHSSSASDATDEDTATRLSGDLAGMNITHDDNESQCSSESNARIIEEDTETELTHNATVQALVNGDAAED